MGRRLTEGITLTVHWAIAALLFVLGVHFSRRGSTLWEIVGCSLVLPALLFLGVGVAATVRVCRGRPSGIWGFWKKLPNWQAQWPRAREALAGLFALTFLAIVFVFIFKLVCANISGRREDARLKLIVDDVRPLVDKCKQMGYHSIALRRPALVWDLDADKPLTMALMELPQEARASSTDKQIAVFMAGHRVFQEGGAYLAKGAARDRATHDRGIPAYQIDVEVSVALWPEKTALGMHTVSCPPLKRAYKTPKPDDQIGIGIGKWLLDLRAAQAADLATPAATVRPGEFVTVRVVPAPVMSGQRTIAVIEDQRSFTAHAVQGQWVRVEVRDRSGWLEGWVHTKYLKATGRRSVEVGDSVSVRRFPAPVKVGTRTLVTLHQHVPPLEVEAVDGPWVRSTFQVGASKEEGWIHVKHLDVFLKVTPRVGRRAYVMTESAPVLLDGREVASLGKGASGTVEAINDPLVKVHVEQAGRRIEGWVHKKHLRFQPR